MLWGLLIWVKKGRLNMCSRQTHLKKKNSRKVTTNAGEKKYSYWQKKGNSYGKSGKNWKKNFFLIIYTWKNVHMHIIYYIYIVYLFVCQ